MTLKIMTFNLRGSFFGEHLDGVNIWQNRADLNLRTIRKYDADLIGFQEYQRGNQKFYDPRLTDYAYEMGLVTVDDSEFGMWNPIYWKADRFSLLDSGGFYLSKTPDVYSSHWDAMLVRAANWVRLHDNHTDETFVFCNHHLDHIGEESRVEGAKIIVERLSSMTEPVIVVADFNSRVWASPDEDKQHPPAGVDPLDLYPPGTVHGVFTRAGYEDTYLAAGHTDAPHINTFHDWRGEDYPPIAIRIDWILGKRVHTKSCDIIRDCEPPLYPSDHYPIVAVVELKG